MSGRRHSHMSQGSVLHLYRHILKAAKHFPSVKKHSLIREIKAEFRAHRVGPAAVSGGNVCAGWTAMGRVPAWPYRVLLGVVQAEQDPERLAHQLKVAHRGLSDLQAYTRMSSDNPTLTLKGATD